MSFFKKTIKSDILQTNQTNLAHISDRFHTHLSRLKTLLFEMNENPQLIGFNHQLLMEAENQVDYLKAALVIESFKNEVFKEQNYLESLLVHFRSTPFAFSHMGSSSASLMFGQLYVSRMYTSEFWHKQFETQANFNILPVDQFMIDHQEKPLLSLTFRKPDSNYQLIALLDMDKAYASFAGEAALTEFIMLDADGSELFRTGSLSHVPLPVADAKEDYVLHDGNYYFLSRNTDGMTYISVVPNADVTQQISRLNVTLLLILAVSLSLALASAYLFSKRIQSPVKRLLTAVLNSKPSLGSSHLKEFSLIHSKINDLLSEKQEIAELFQKQNSVLTSYTYMSQLKSINTDISGFEDFLSETDQSCIVVLYTLRYRKIPNPETNSLDDSPLARQILERIHLQVSDRYPGSNTFQIEINQIVTVFPEAERETLKEFMKELKLLLIRDLHNCAVTIAISTRFVQPSEFYQAYQEAQQMSRQVSLSAETQIISEVHEHSPVALSQKQEQSLVASLQAGNEEGAVQIVEQLLEQLSGNQSRLNHYEELAVIISSKLMTVMASLPLATEACDQFVLHSERLKTSFTAEEYKDNCHALLSFAFSMIQAKKEEQDPVAALVMDILQTRYAQDLSLSYLADLLNMSSTYLSVYIKDKTGANFSDHLNGIRVRKAQELLISTEMNIMDISKQVGYSNFTSFNRMFKKQTGMAPTEYRKQQIMQIHKIG